MAAVELDQLRLRHLLQVPGNFLAAEPRADQELAQILVGHVPALQANEIVVEPLALSSLSASSQ